MSAYTVRISTDAAERSGLQPLSDTLLPPTEAPDSVVWLASSVDEPARVRACLRLQRRIGLQGLRAWYRLGWAVHAAGELQLFRQLRTLLLGNDWTGADELTGFAIAPDLAEHTAQALWAALGGAALQALAQQPGGVARPCVAELPGVLDGQGQSPFWAGLGRHFYPHELAAARQAHGPGFDGDIAALLPRHLLYASFLPAAAQAAMGQPCAAAKPLQAALHELGFRWRDHITVTDGGAVWVRDAAA